MMVVIVVLLFSPGEIFPEEVVMYNEVTFNNQSEIFHCGADAVCITTNGCNRKDGKAVMGRGIAAYVAERDPVVQTILGQINAVNWGEVAILRQYKNGLSIVSFPVKPNFGPVDDALPHLKKRFAGQNYAPGWACRARLSIIESSACQLMNLIIKHNWTKVMLPAPGCGNGGLKYEDVKKSLIHILDDRVHVSFLSR